MKAVNWIDRVKVAKNWDSDYRAAKELGLGRQTISTYRSKLTNTMDEDTCVKVAHALSIDPALILADQAMERAKNQEARTAWIEVIQRLGGVAAGVLVAVGMGSASAPAQAAQIGADGQPVYIMLSRRRNKKGSAAARILAGFSAFNPFTPAF